MLIGIASTHGKEINDFMIVAFWEVLKAYPLEDVNKAFIEHLGDTDYGQFMPKPADIKRLIEGSSQERAKDAFAKLDYALRCCGPYRTVRFADPIITPVINALGGWAGLSKLTDSEYQFYKKDFVDRYCVYIKSGILPSDQQLLGFEALSNLSLGVELSEPILIGVEKNDSQFLIDSKNPNSENEPEIVRKIDE